MRKDPWSGRKGRYMGVERRFIDFLTVLEFFGCAFLDHFGHETDVEWTKLGLKNTNRRRILRWIRIWCQKSRFIDFSFFGQKWPFLPLSNYWLFQIFGTLRYGSDLYIFHFLATNGNFYHYRIIDYFNFWNTKIRARFIDLSLFGHKWPFLSNYWLFQFLEH